MPCREIPYATEQGIFGAITGNFRQRTGNFLPSEQRLPGEVLKLLGIWRGASLADVNQRTGGPAKEHPTVIAIFERWVSDRECTSGRARNWASCSPLASERGRVFPLSGGPSKHGSLFQGLRLAVMPSAPGTPMRLFLAYAIRLNCPASATTQTVSREGAAGGVHACPHRCNACLFRIIRWRAGRQFAFWRRVEQAQPIDCSGSGRRLLRHDHACSAAPAARAVSFPKIISARSNDAVLTKSAQ